MFGALTAAGAIDVPRMRAVRQLCADLRLTFHRAFDVCTDPIDSSTISALLSIGCDRLLTSGRAVSALSGAAVLRELCSLTQGSGLKVAAAAGVAASNAAEIIAQSGVLAVHAGSSVTRTISNALTSPLGQPIVSMESAAAVAAAAVVEAVEAVEATTTPAAAGSSPPPPSSSPSIRCDRFDPTDMKEWSCAQYDLTMQLYVNAQAQWGNSVVIDDE